MNCLLRIMEEKEEKAVVIFSLSVNLSCLSMQFRKEKDNDIEELKLRVVFVTADPPSPIPEVSEEEFSPEAPEVENPDHNNRIMALFDAVSARFCWLGFISKYYLCNLVYYGSFTSFGYLIMCFRQLVHVSSMINSPRSEILPLS